MTFELLTQYYGVDLIATAITFLGIYQLGNKKRIGFIMTLIGNLMWLAFGVMTSSLGILIANLGLAMLNIRGYYKWGKTSLP